MVLPFSTHVVPLKQNADNNKQTADKFRLTMTVTSTVTNYNTSLTLLIILVFSEELQRIKMMSVSKPY